MGRVLKIGRNQLSIAVSNAIAFRFQVSMAYNSEKSEKAKKKKIHQSPFLSHEERPHLANPVKCRYRVI